MLKGLKLPHLTGGGGTHARGIKVTNKFYIARFQKIFIYFIVVPKNHAIIIPI
jgi:hypothetical protein